ncbi:MAG TPA: transketolase family protein, partial [Candidatus Binatia bacterium]|nr:transketolase family protein [Candidatus Binatia bacterium]
MSELHLATHLDNLDPIRKGFGRGLLAAGQINPNVVAACADLTESTQMHLFAEAFPERFVEIGVAEQNLVTVGSGLAAMGKIPYVSSYAAFSPGRNWEQIRTTIALNDRPVRIIGSHAGLYTGADGATH